LHGLPSAKTARRGLEEIYRGIDRLVGELAAACPDAVIVLFSMHGMGRNEADVAAMLLLPELLYRHGFGKPYARDKTWPGYLEDGTPLLAENSNWDQAIEEIVPRKAESHAGTFSRFMKRLGFGKYSSLAGTAPLDWMPAARYRRFWPQMQAFALPSFYDGRIRINLRGRESNGIVSRAEYDAVCDGLCDVLRNCRNAQSGEPIVQEIVRTAKDPMRLNAFDMDIAVVFRSAPLGITHPKLGTVGPFPWRRTGGHTGASGFLYLAGKDIEPGDRGRRSSFDVVPTVVDLLGGRGDAFSGKSIVSAARSRLRVSV
jgi:predicted AlkP superfamily phosphohydrolase/phosphomutase